MSIFFTPNPNLQQQKMLLQFRRRILNWVLGITAVLSILYLAVWRIGWINHALLPLDGVIFLGLSLVCLGLSRIPKWGVPLAAAIYIAGFSQPFFFATQTFGLNAPTTAGFVVAILLCGLLIGGWFLNVWILAHCLWIIGEAFFEFNGRYTPPNAIQTQSEVVSSILFWCGLLIISGLLIRFMIRHLERALQIANGQAALLNRVLQTLTTESDIGSFLRQTLLTAGEQIGSEGISLFFYDEAADELRPFLFYMKQRVYTPEEIPEPITPMPAATVPIWQTLRQTKAPFVIDDIANDPRLKLKSRLIAEGVQKILYVPLKKADQLIGWMSFNSTNSASFWPEDLELAELLGKQVTLGIQLNELAEQAKTQAGETAVVDERNRMAREIHDTLAQGFTGIVVQLEAAEDILAKSPEEAGQHINRARALAKDSLQEARRSVWNLRPQALETNDLPQAMHRTLQKLAPGTLVNSEVKVIGTARPLPPEIETDLLRIMQEASTNALKHAKPSKITVWLDYSQPERLTMRVVDNGRGFDPAQPTAGFGLTSMRERAMQINGRINVTMRPEGGTEVVCTIPLKNQ